MSLKDQYTSALDTPVATIASGTSLSDGINLGGLRLFSIKTPDPWTAANMTFQASHNGGATWEDLYKGGAEYVHPAVAGKDDDVDVQRFSCVPMLRVRSGTAAAPVAQDADRQITLVLRAV